MLRIKELRQSKGITQSKLAEILKISRSTIAMYEIGASEPDIVTLQSLANYFGVSVDFLLGKSENNVEGIKFNRDVIKVPIYGNIPAGTPIDMIEDSFIEDYEEIDANLARGDKVFFGLKIKGNSMYPEFRDGDNVIFQKHLRYYVLLK